MKKIILTVITALSLALAGPLVVLQPAYAACPSSDTPKGQVLKGVGETGGECDASGVSNFVSAVVNILSIIVGIAAVIVIILSGMKYITSAGDTAKITAAKNTLIYALIGVAIAALAQFMVHFVLNQSTQSTLPDCGAHQSPAGGTCVKR